MTALEPDDFKQTHLGQVENWEIDQNRHWSARFYVRAFETAMDWALSAPAHADEQPRVVHRHMTYLSELLADDPFEIRSAVHPGNASHVSHMMRNIETGAICATATDVLSTPIASLPVLRTGVSERFRPRSLSLAPILPVDTAPLLDDDTATVSYRGVVRPNGVDHRDRMLAFEIHDCISKGQSVIWQHAGLPAPVLFRNDIGRVAVEMAMTFHRPAASGEAIEIVSWFERLSPRVVLVRDQLNGSDDGEPVASIRTVNLFLDQTTRKIMALPDEMIGRLRAPLHALLNA